MIVALARPQATIPVPQNTGTVILSIDVSGSMLAEDVEPNRMEATKKAVREFVEKQPKGVKIGVVSFSDFAALVAPPTTRPQAGARRDRPPAAAARHQHRRRPAGRARRDLRRRRRAPTSRHRHCQRRRPRRRRARRTQDAAGQHRPALGRAEQHRARPAARSPRKPSRRHQGLHDRHRHAGGHVLQIQGRNVFTRLDETTLRSVAEEDGRRATSAPRTRTSSSQIYDELARERQFEDEETEITFAFAGAALVISIIAGGLGLLWFNRLP